MNAKALTPKNTGLTKSKRGRKPFCPTDDERKLVESLSGYGVPQHQINHLVRGGIDHETLIKHFRVELDAGKAKANARVAKTLYDKALSGDTASLIWWSKSQLRWAERHEHEHSGPGGGPLEVVWAGDVR